MVWHGLSPDAEQELVAARGVVALLVLVVVVVVVLLLASGTAVLQTVFALAMQVFVVRIHRTACALVAVKVLIWLFAFRLDARTDLFGGFLVSWTQEWEWSWWRNHR